MNVSRRSAHQREQLLLALLDGPLGGTELQQRMAAGGVVFAADSLLTFVLAAERKGLVAVERRGGYRFSLTPPGEAAALALGRGTAAASLLVMADLVGFVSFTEQAGDEAARDAAAGFAAAADERLGSVGGRVVKRLGDGILGVLEPDGDPRAPLRALARDCDGLGGHPWKLRAAAHGGRPIHDRGDVYGRDVNLVARLCDLAEPGQLVWSTGEAAEMGRVEHLAVRGVADPVPVVREVL